MVGDPNPPEPAAIELAVCSEMVFLELPVAERVRRIDELGFQVEIWDWTGKDVDALAATGARFSSMTGYVRGELADPAGPRSCCARPRGPLRWPSGWAARG